MDDCWPDQHFEMRAKVSDALGDCKHAQQETLLTQLPWVPLLTLLRAGKDRKEDQQPFTRAEGEMQVLQLLRMACGR
jgi:hypothetical protein